MKREFLNGLNLDKEVIDQIMTEYGKDINAEKAKTQAAEVAKAALENDLQQAMDTIDGFKAKDLDVEKIQTLAQDWENKYKQAEAQRQADLKANALLAELNNSGTVDVDLLKACIDQEKLIYNDGAFIGLNEQIAGLKESKPYLFKQEQPETKPALKGAKFNESGEGDNDSAVVDPSKMSYPEYVAYLETLN